MFIGKNTTSKPMPEILTQRGILFEALQPPTVQTDFPISFGKYLDSGRSKFFFEIHEVGFDYDSYASYIFYDIQPTTDQIVVAVRDTEKFSSCSV